MPTYQVDVDKKTYEVDAPDPDTAWKWANQFHGESAKTKPYDVNSSVASLMNVGQALTFGFGDELAGMVGADKNRYRATVDQFRKDYPAAGHLGTISGSLLLPGGAGKLATQSPLIAASTVGALTGALQGMGDAPDIEKGVNDASRQAIIGMAGGPMIMGMAKPVSDLTRSLGTKIPYIGDSLATDLARRRIATSFERDSTTANDVGSNMARLGAESRVADAAGENTRTMLDLNANLPGKTQNDLETVNMSRIKSRPERMDSAVYAVNGGYGRATPVYEALEKQKKDTAAPLYAQLHQMEIIPSDKLAKSLEAAKKAGAFGEASKIANADEVAFTLKDIQAQQTVTGKANPLTNTSQTTQVGGTKLSMADLDYAKRGIDALIEKETDAVTGKVSTYGRSLVMLKNRIVDELDTQTNGAYKAARDAFAGPAALQTAIKKGKSFWNEDADTLANMMQGMSQSEQEAFRIGASEAMRSMVGSQTGQNRLLNVLNDRNIRERLQSLLGNDAKYSDVERMLLNEGTLKRLESLGPSRNSRTFSRLAASEDQAMGVATDLAQGVASPQTLPLSIMSSLKKNYSTLTNPEPVRDAIGKILLQQYQPAEMKALQEVQDLIRRQQAAAAAGTGLLGGKFDPTK